MSLKDCPLSNPLVEQSLSQHLKLFFRHEPGTGAIVLHTDGMSIMTETSNIFPRRDQSDKIGGDQFEHKNLCSIIFWQGVLKI